MHRKLTYEQQPDDDRHNALEARLKGEARLLVNKRISDRKKAIVALLVDGYNQSSAASKLGIKNRQTVCKALQSIPKDYRLDLLCSANGAE